MYQVKTPIVICVFNRPVLTEILVKRIRDVSPEKVYVVADGPRSDREGEEILCRQTREIVEEYLGNQCQLIKNYSDENLGCKQRVASGLDWVFEKEEMAIVLEDDCLPDESFFRFCDELLIRYQNDSGVHMIGGSRYLPEDASEECSYYFSNMYHIWGWATWRRAWETFDVTMCAWEKLRQTDWIETKLQHKHMTTMARFFLDETFEGRINTWDYQWVLSGWLNNALAIVPKVNMVTNTGFGADATHMTNSNDRLSGMVASVMDFPLMHPGRIEAVSKKDLLEFEMIYGKTLLETSFPKKIRKLMRRFTGVVIGR